MRRDRRVSPRALARQVHWSTLRMTSPPSSLTLSRHAFWERRRGMTWFGSFRVHLLDLLPQHRFALTHLPPAPFDTVVDEGATLVIATDATPWQGSRHATRRTLAHAMHGVRPYQLMCGLARMFARQYGMACVLTGARERSPRYRRWLVSTDARRDTGTSRRRIGNDEGKALSALASPVPLTANAHCRSASRRRVALRAAAEGLLVRALREADLVTPAPPQPPRAPCPSLTWRGHGYRETHP